MQPSDAASPYGQHALAPSGELIEVITAEHVGEHAGYVTAEHVATTREIHAASTPAGSLTLAGWPVRVGGDDHKQYRSRGAGC